MKYTIHFLSCLLLLFSASQSISAQKKIDLKRINEFYHVPNQNTNRLVAVRGIFGKEDLEYHYNERNNIIRMDHFQTNDENGPRDLVSYELYLYNDKGQCWQIETYDYRKGFTDLVVSKRDVFDYNDKGQVTLYTRWYNLNTEASDTTLVEDRKIEIQYTAEGLPSKAHVRFRDNRSFEWYDSFDITLDYNERGQLYKRISELPQGIVEKEEITFDEKGQYMKKFTLTSAANGVKEWIYTPDDKGNLVSFGTSDFPTECKYVLNQKAEETFYPQPHLATLILNGIRDFNFLEIPLLYNSSLEAVESCELVDSEGATSGGKFIYEENKPTYILPIYNTTKCALTYAADSWVVEGAEYTVQLYSLDGHCLLTTEPSNNCATIYKNGLPKGQYLIKVGSEIFKVVR